MALFLQILIKNELQEAPLNIQLYIWLIKSSNFSNPRILMKVNLM